MEPVAKANAEDLQRTKMVCTLGPSSNRIETIRELILAGMDVARLNLSHGEHADHRQVFETVRRAADEAGRNVAVLADLQGPKIRTGRLEGGGPVELEEGAEVVIVPGDGAGTARRLSTSYDHLVHDVKKGDRILVSDGRLELRVEKVSPPEVHCRVARGGELKENQGINLPGVDVSAPSLTEKDLEDLEFLLGLGVDYIALSFVRRPEDVAALQGQIRRAGKMTPVVAKIERPEAVEEFDRILDVTEAVMVARGDLGVEVELEEVPRIQKDIIRRCNERARPVITATQMLESMIENSRPTRAEVADVANAIYDGTDAVMLSGETAAGKYPVETARVMARIAAATDRHIAARTEPEPCLGHARFAGEDAYAQAIGEAVHRVSHVIEARRIVCFTRSGRTASAVARLRPQVPITAITLTEETRRRCALIWGVDAFCTEDIHSVGDMGKTVDRLLGERGLVAPGETVVIVAGMPSAVEGRTNLLHLHTVGQ